MTFLFATSLLFSCSSDVETANPMNSCRSEENSSLFVFQNISYARRENDIAWGFNIDDHISDANDEEGCYHKDLIDPLGNEGIDNAMSALIPTLDLTEAFAVEGIIEDSINNGELILMLQLLGLDNSEQDDCMELRILKGEGNPMVGTNGQLLDGQSFSINTETPPSVVENVAIEEGTFLANPLEMDIPVRVLDKNLVFSMKKGSLRGTFQDDGTLTGSLGGALSLFDLIEIVSFEEVADTDILISLLKQATDLSPNEEGTCEELSVAFEFTAIPAYIYQP